jgi:pilus assembly protein FimV
MTVRFDSVPVAMKRRAAHAAIAAAFIALSGLASAQGGKAASAAPAAAPVFKIIGHYGVKPGQSLHDIAAELAQSNDKHVIATVSRALFEANPNAFAKQDPSRLKIGAELKVPEVPGLVEPAPQAAAPAPAAPVPAPAQAPVHAPASPAAASPAKIPAPATPAAPTAPVVASVPAVTVAPNGPAAVAAATASTAAPSSAPLAASAPSAAVAPGASAVAGASAAAVGASAPATALAASGASASVAASVPAAATSASDTHVWSGSIQAAPAGAAASGVAQAQGASAVKVPVTLSSLQQLLALKNRVLMALQQHGIGQSPQAAAGGNGKAASVAGAPGAKATAGGAGARTSGFQLELSPLMIGIAAAVVALLVLFLGWLTLGRKKPVDKAADKAADVAPEHVEPPVLDTPLRASEPRATAAPVTAAAAAPAPAQRDEVLDHATRTAGLSAAASLGGEALPPARFDVEPDELPQSGPVARDDRVEHGVTARGVERGAPETLADASEAASFTAAAELGASALPLAPVEALRTEGEVEKLAREAEPEQGPDWLEAEAARKSSVQGHDEPEAAPEEAARHVANEPEKPAPQQAAEPQPARFEEPPVPALPVEDAKAAEMPAEFPSDAVSALGGIDMTLPPRVAEPVAQAAPLSTQPVASPEATAAQAVPLSEPSAPRVAEAIAAGTAGAGATAGLGAPRFGALTLDFDLNLPPDSAEPLPVFTPEQLARIARNKLELAHEYIALGDLGGARALINEVIDSNDGATRADAQALLSTLAPLS